MSISKAIVERAERLAKVAELSSQAPEGSFEEVLLMKELKEAYANLLESAQSGYDNADLYTGKAVDNYNYKNKTEYKEADFDVNELFGSYNPFFEGGM